MYPFEDWTIEQLVSLIACVTGIIMMFMSVRRDSEADRERQAAHAAEQQVITDKLDSISDMSKETRREGDSRAGDRRRRVTAR